MPRPWSKSVETRIPDTDCACVCEYGGGEGPLHSRVIMDKGQISQGDILLFIA